MSKELLAVLTDTELGKEDHPMGHVVHLSTVTHAFRGKLEAVTPTYYVLSDARIVMSTGELSAYYRTKNASEEESIGGEVRVLRAAVAWVLVW